MAGSRVSLKFQHGRELRDLFQLTTVRLVELQYVDPELCDRASSAVTSAINGMDFGRVEVDAETMAVRCDLAALTDRIGEAFTAAGARPEFLKPVYRSEGLGWYRHVGWRVGTGCAIASAIACMQGGPTA